MVLGTLVEGLDCAFYGVARVVMIPVIDDAGLEFKGAVFIDDVIDDRRERFTGPEDVEL